VRDAQDQRSGVQVVARAAAILRLLADPSGGLTFTELVARAGLPRTTVHRICRALEEEGFVVADASTGQLRLGPGLLRLAVTSRRDLHTVVGPHLERLSRHINETVDLAVLDGTHVLFIAQHPAPLRDLMAVSRVGARFPAHCTSNGKVLLAQLPPDQLRRHLPKKLTIPARHTPISFEELQDELEQVRRSGIGYDREEHRPGICAVGIAICGVDGTVAAISVPMPAARFYQDEAVVVEALRQSRDEVQAALQGS
jgi:DNA-binding IclR family transcriptional regulator